MVDIVTVPFDLCGPHHGSRLGPLAMLLEGLLPSLREIGIDAKVTEVLPVDGKMSGSREERDRIGLEVYAKTRDATAKVIRDSRLPLVIGGDHSISIGSISGALEACGEGLAVLWIDAHMDVNTPDTSQSGQLHGMALGALARLEPQTPIERLSRRYDWSQCAYALWPKLLDLVPAQGLGKDKLGWIGLRDVDPGEIASLKQLPGSFVATMHDIDNQGLVRIMEGVGKWLEECRATSLWVSFDVDVLDPIFAPGTGTAVRGGLSYREGHLLAETLFSMVCAPGCPYKLVGLDVVEVNPLHDRGNETARIAMEWVCSLLGKTIMDKYHPGQSRGGIA